MKNRKIKPFLWLKKFSCMILVFAMVFSGASYTAPVKAAETNSAMKTFPAVAEYKSTGGEFSLTDTSRLVIISSNLTLQNEILENDLKLLSSEFNQVGLTSNSMNIVYGSETTPKAGDIVVRMTEPSKNVSREAYTIAVGDYAEVSASGEAGIFYGVRTIQKTLLLNDKKMDKGTISDAPAVEVRGFHLDNARKMFTKDWILAQIKDLSYQNFNTIQFHFSENEGYRLESSTLEAIDGWRYPSDGYFTKKDMLDIIAECQKYHIELVPSLDSPGHMSYVLGFLPDDWDCSSIWSESTDFRSVQTFNIFEKQECQKFLKDLFAEYAEFFSEAGCKHFNIGGDEFLNQFGRMTSEQYILVMDYFNEISALVKSYGMTPRAWNDGLMYGNYTGYTLDPDIEICYWSGPAGTATVKKFTDNGNKVINMADSMMYYVLGSWWMSSANPEGSRVYSDWDPGKLPGSADHGSQTMTYPYDESLLGASFAIWCDTPSMRTEGQIADAIYMRTRATAQKCWNPVTSITYSELESRCNTLGRAPGYDGNTLPASGEVLYEGDFGTLILKFTDKDGNSIKEDSVSYGLVDEAYTITPEKLYGYKFVSMDKAAEGVYTDSEIIVTLTYELFTDKTALEAAVLNKKAETDYIPATYASYKEALADAEEVLANNNATQKETDAALASLTKAESKLVNLDRTELYLALEYPVAEAGYTPATYNEYKTAIEAGQEVLSNPDAAAEEIQAAIEAIDTKKAALAVPADMISVTANKGFYKGWVDYVYGEWPASNMLDGNVSTKAWTDGPQTEGDYFLFTFTQPVTLNSLRIQFTDSSDYIYGADIETSIDNSTWNKIGAIDNTGNPQLDVSFDAEGATVQYVRIRITKTVNNWTQINEVSFNYEAEASDNSALKTAVDDAAKLTEEDYTAASWTVFTAALKNAEKVLNDNGATTGEITAAATALEACKDALISASGTAPEPTATPEITEVPQPTVTEAPQPTETEAPQPSETPEAKEDVTTVFDDVYADWYTEYVQYVYDNTLMTGIKGTKHFAPFENITKAQVAQVLYNMEGQPKVDLGSADAFKELIDVYDAEWYAPAVAWAYETGVVTGDLNAKKFSPDADVTREQLALMMYRYAKHKGYDVSATSDFAGLANADKIADWSMAGMKWAVGEGLISGAEVNGIKDLNPQGSAQRAQVAAILKRFCENVK